MEKNDKAVVRLLRAFRTANKAWDNLHAAEELFLRRVHEARQILTDTDWDAVEMATGVDLTRDDPRTVFGDMGA